MCALILTLPSDLIQLLDFVTSQVFLPLGGGYKNATTGVITVPTYHYGPDAGPPWFLGWLLLFNVCYAIIRGCTDEQSKYRYKRKSFLFMMCAFGLPLGIVQSVLMAILPGSFMMMPLTIGSLPLDVAFFIGGTPNFTVLFVHAISY